MDGYRDIVRAALQEDIGHGDLTTLATVPEDARCAVRIVAREPGVMSGVGLARTVFDETATDVAQWKSITDGDSFAEGDVVVSFKGLTRGALTGERVALNFLQRLCGVATITRRFADALEGTSANVCDTRKTTPLLRSFEKNAVLHGGGSNHRFGLSDAILVKENHVAAAGSVRNAIEQARAYAGHTTKVEVEVENLDQLEEALAASPDIIMLDNMDTDMIRAAVAKRGSASVILEASGNMTLERARQAALAGVDYVSVGALTHSVKAIDLSMLIEPNHD